MTKKEQKELDSEPLQNFKKAAKIFENLISDSYEKMGKSLPTFIVTIFSEINKANERGIKKDLVKVTPDDNDNTKELKEVLKSIYQKVQKIPLKQKDH
jgi:hypothetical protein